MGVRPREGGLGDAPPPAPWCRGVARAKEGTGLPRGTEDWGRSAGLAAEASTVAAMSSLPTSTYAARGQPAEKSGPCQDRKVEYESRKKD